ncbi:hypothetical protein Tco_1438401 [Tanacetum coccineum]
MHSKGDDSPITKLSNTVKGTYMFGIEIPDTMINNAFKQSAGYKYYKAKKIKSKKAKAAEEPEEQNMKTSSLTVAEETVAVKLAKSISNDEQRPIVDDPAVQSLLDLQKRLKASRLESLKQKKQAVACKGPSDVHIKYYDTSDTESPHDSSNCQTRNSLVYEPNPSNNYDFPSFDQPLQYHIDDSQQFYCCEHCGGSHYGSDCQTVNVFYEHAPYNNHDSSAKINHLQEMLHHRNSNQDHPVELYDPEGSHYYMEVPIDNEQILRQHYTAHVMPPPLAYTPPPPFLTTTTLARENDEFIKSSVDDFVLIPKGV